jgi:hypothetical protein
LRFYRLCAYKIVQGYRGSADMEDIKSFISLPYDFELDDAAIQQMDSDTMNQWYQNELARAQAHKWN